jgi:RNA polymerase sigma-70 factor (ECF subfamily)
MPGEPRLRHNPLVDPRELEQLHDQCFSWALTCTRGRRSEAEDVLQMTYLAIMEGHARFGGESSLKTWMFAVIRNQARSRSRRVRYALRSLSRMATLAADEYDSHEPQHDETHRLVAALHALPDRQREVLDLVFYRGLAIAEAAKVLGIALGTARIHYERGKAALRRQLAPLERTS